MYLCLYSKYDFNIILLLEIYVTSNNVLFAQLGEVVDHNTRVTNTEVCEFFSTEIRQIHTHTVYLCRN
jgi:hypothetical protein